jgi:hypothetical protein
VPPDLFGLEQNSEKKRRRGEQSESQQQTRKKTLHKQACISKERVCEMDQGTSVKLRPT